MISCSFVISLISLIIIISVAYWIRYFFVWQDWQEIVRLYEKNNVNLGNDNIDFVFLFLWT